MSDFLARLAERQLSETAGVSPRLPSRFAPSAPVGMDESISDGVVTEPNPDRSVKIVHRAWPASKHDEAQHASDLYPKLLAPSDPPMPTRSDPIGKPQVTQMAERLVPVSVDDPRKITPNFQSAPPVVMVHELSRPLVPTDTRQETIFRVEPRAGITSADTDSTVSVHHAVAPSREPLVPPRRDLLPEALPTFTAPEVPRARAEAEPSVVHVSIGQIEVRAVMEPPPPQQRPTPPKPKTKSLEEYLERRHGSRR